MKAVLELTKIRDEGDIFYRYDIDGTKVWFEQYQSNGHICSVSIRPNEELEDFDFYVDDNFEDCYPMGVYVHIGNTRLTMEQVDEFVGKVQYAKQVIQAVEGIFESGIHRECYEKHHKED